MTEEIVIDGVDVAGCCFYNNGKCDNPNGMACNCINNAVCYFKELKRLKQENKELKKDVQLFKCLDTFGESECHCACRCLGNEFCEDADKKINSYRSALEEIKTNFMCFRSCMIPFHVGNKENLPHKMADAIQNCCESIINKINEVLQ